MEKKAHVLGITFLSGRGCWHWVFVSPLTKCTVPSRTATGNPVTMKTDSRTFRSQNADIYSRFSRQQGNDYVVAPKKLVFSYQIHDNFIQIQSRRNIYFFICLLISLFQHLRLWYRVSHPLPPPDVLHFFFDSRSRFKNSAC